MLFPGGRSVRKDYPAIAALLFLLMASVFVMSACSKDDEGEDQGGNDKDDYGICRNHFQLVYWQCTEDCKAKYADDACGLEKCIYGSQGCGIPYYTQAVDCGSKSDGYNPYPAIDVCRLACEKTHGQCVDANCDDTTACDTVYNDCRDAC